jgi:hypothetical protein
VKNQDMRILLEASASILDDDTVEALTLNLLSNPMDRVSRLKLLGHYFVVQLISKKVQVERLSLLHWFIENEPSFELLQWLQLSLDLCSSEQMEELLLKYWMEAIKHYPNESKTLINAAHFFKELKHFELAEETLYAALKADSSSTKAVEKLVECLASRLDSAATNNYGIHVQQEQIRQSLNEILEKISDPTVNYMLLEQLAEFTFSKKLLDISKRLALELLNGSNTAPNWYSATAIHQAKIILGKLALEEDDLNSAKMYLADAGNVVTPSPQLISFGPNLSLAKKLVAVGEIESVTSFLRDCQSWWESGRDLLDHWVNELQDTGNCSFDIVIPSVST